MKVSSMNARIIILFAVFTCTASFTMEKERKDGLFLIVGCCRKECSSPTFPIAQLWGESYASHSHMMTYAGKATTFDIRESKIPDAAHIVGDARFYQFGLNSINAAYLERLPTCIITQEQFGGRYIEDCIENIAGSMIKGAKMEIEWEPYVRFSFQDPDTVRKLYDKKIVRKTPFTHVIDCNLARLGVLLACQGSFSTQVSEKFYTAAELLSKTILDLLVLYEKEKVGKKELLLKRLEQEIYIWEELVKKKKQVLLPCDPSASLKTFSQEIEGKKVFFIKVQPHLIGTWVGIIKDGKFITGIAHDANSFLSKSFFKFILNESYIILNQPHVKRFMKKSGFEHVCIVREKSSHNNRKNVWIVSGIKA